MTQESFVGTWRLISFELKSVDEQASYPFGKDAVGYIMYTEDGYMSVVIMSTNRPKFAFARSIRGGTSEDKVAATIPISLIAVNMKFRVTKSFITLK